MRAVRSRSDFKARFGAGRDVRTCWAHAERQPHAHTPRPRPRYVLKGENSRDEEAGCGLGARSSSTDRTVGSYARSTLARAPRAAASLVVAHVVRAPSPGQNPFQLRPPAVPPFARVPSGQLASGCRTPRYLTIARDVARLLHRAGGRHASAALAAQRPDARPLSHAAAAQLRHAPPEYPTAERRRRPEVGRAGCIAEGSAVAPQLGGVVRVFPQQAVRAGWPRGRLSAGCLSPQLTCERAIVC